MATIPTDEGRRRYPATQGYFVFDSALWIPTPGQLDRLACTCLATCPRPCRGACGCNACGWRHAQESHMGRPNISSD